MAEYTPTTSEILAAYVIGEHLTNPAFPVKETEACFRNWLAAHDAEVNSQMKQRIREMEARSRGLVRDYEEQYRRADDALEAIPAPPVAGEPERKALRGVIGGVLCNAFYFPKKVTVRILGQDMGPLIDRTADAIAAAGYTKLRTVATVEELDALPRLTAILNRGRVWQKLGGKWPYHEWQCADGGFQRNSTDMAALNTPATVLHAPDSPPAAHSSPVDASGAESDTTGATEATGATGDAQDVRGNG